MWRNIKERYNLVGTTCEVCGTSFFPKRLICPKCRRKGKLVEAQMPHTGKIASFTRVHVAPKGFEHESPYWLAVIYLDNGAHILSQIVDSKEDQIKIGAKVEMTFRKIYEDGKHGAIAYGYKFRVV